MATKIQMEIQEQNPNQIQWVQPSSTYFNSATYNPSFGRCWSSSLAGSISTHCCRCQMGLELFFSFLSQKLWWHLTNYVQGSLLESASPWTHAAYSRSLCTSSSSTTKRDIKHLQRKAKWQSVSQFSRILFQLLSHRPVFHVWMLNADGSELLAGEPEKKPTLSQWVSHCLVSIKVCWLLNKLSSKTWHREHQSEYVSL